MKHQPGYLLESRASFPTTDWSLIRDAQDLSRSQRGVLLGAIIRHYWKPLYAFYRSQGQSPADAEDTVQGLFTAILEGEKITHPERQKGRFRDWLITCARNYLRDRVRHANAQKRRPSDRLVSLDDMRKTDGVPFEPPETLNPDAAYLDAWRRELLRRALDIVGDECERKDRVTDLRLFVDYYVSVDDEKPTWKLLAQRYEIGDWKKAAHKAEWVKGLLNRALRQLIREYVATDDEIDDELRLLLQ